MCTESPVGISAIFFFIFIFYFRQIDMEDFYQTQEYMIWWKYDWKASRW